MSLYLRKKEPQTIVACAFIQCAKPVMTCTDDARTASSNVKRHHSLQAWEQLVGNEWREAGHARTATNSRRTRATLQNEKFNYPS